MSYPAWGVLISADKVGRVGLARNEYGATVTVFVCEACLSLFTVTDDVSEETFGKACLAETCDSYDVARDVDLLFDIELWQINREEGA